MTIRWVPVARRHRPVSVTITRWSPWNVGVLDIIQKFELKVEVNCTEKVTIYNRSLVNFSILYNYNLINPRAKFTELFRRWNEFQGCLELLVQSILRIKWTKDQTFIQKKSTLDPFIKVHQLTSLTESRCINMNHQLSRPYHEWDSGWDFNDLHIEKNVTTCRHSPVRNTCQTAMSGDVMTSLNTVW